MASGTTTDAREVHFKSSLLGQYKSSLLGQYKSSRRLRLLGRLLPFDRMGTGLDLGLLGPFEVRLGSEPVALGGLRQRALLAVLALNANEVVSTDRLVDQLWGESPPATALHTVQVFVSRLRTALGSAGERLVTRLPGYVLEVGIDEIDADRCERLYASARSALAAGEAAGAVAILGDAQALWRGPPLADFTYEPFAQAAIARLEELRLSCREELIEAQLALGRHAEVISDLELLVREQPFRERPHGQLMLALYRCGRQADALKAYRHVRRTLIDELGVEPSRALRDLEEMILGQDDSLEAQPESAAVAMGRQPERQAPPATTSRRAQPSEAPPSPSASSAPLAGEASSPPVMLRRTATVLVAQLSAAGHADPERSRTLIAAARQKVEQVVTRHGGAFVSGLTPQVVGIFGFPKTREDDAVRALRAAHELRRDVPSAIGEDPDGPIVRLALDTGEVVAEKPEEVFGPPVDRAVVLASIAVDAEILLTDATRRSAGGAVVTELMPDGIAWRLINFVIDRPVLDGPIKTPMFGRQDELATACATFARAAHDGSAHLLTVLGDPGIGKSRFAQALADRLGDEATVLAGRCLAYGEGVTFWPLREAITTIAGGESKEAIDKLFLGVRDADILADITAACLGLTQNETKSEQIPWAIRRLLEKLASGRPLLVVIEDAHWAEPPLLDLIDYLIDWLTAPVMILCLARPEILDERPRWGGGHERVCSIVLVPLADEQARRLVKYHLGDRELSATASAQILATAEGNPLFVEQLLAIGDEDPAWALGGQLPATIQTLLAARLDRLGPAERALVERAAVIGREFWTAAVVDLLPAEARPSAGEHLRNLIRRGLIHPARSTLTGEEQLLFHHVLIRDVAYHSTPKTLRSDLHEHFAHWLVELGDTYDEFVGYHLQRAFRLRTELGQADAAALGLAVQAGERLAAAGRRAFARSEATSAVRLLNGAAEMFDAGDHRRPDVLLDLGVAMRESGELRQAEHVLRDAVTQATATEAEALGARALIELWALRSLVDKSIRVEDTEAVAKRAMRVFRRLGDEAGLSRALMEIAEAHWTRCCFADMEGVLEQALVHARRAGDREPGRILRGLARAAVMGPRPVEDAIQRCSMVLEQTRGDLPSTAYAEAMLAVLKAMEGHADQARDLYGRSQRRLEENGLEVTASLQLMYRAFIELLSEAPMDITPELARAGNLLHGIGELSCLSTIAALHAQLLYGQGLYDECELYSQMSADAAAEDDVVSQVLSRGVAAKLIARSGDAPLAEAMINRAVALAETTDFLLIRGHVLRDRAEVLKLVGQGARAVRDLELAITLYERKGIRVLAADARRLHRGLVRKATLPAASATSV